RIWDLGTDDNKQMMLRSFEQRWDFGTVSCFGGGGGADTLPCLLATTSGQGRRISVWDVKSARILHIFDGPLRSFVSGLSFGGRLGGAAAGVGRGLELASCGAGTVKLWDIETLQLLRSADAKGVSCVAFLEAENLLALAGDSGDVLLYEI